MDTAPKPTLEFGWQNGRRPAPCSSGQDVYRGGCPPKESIVQYPATFWHVEHRRFERLLAFLETQMGILRAGELPNYELMCDVLHYLCHLGARHHHDREDIAFGYIVQGNPAMSGTIERLVQQHAEMATRGEALSALLPRAAAGDALARASLEDVMGAYLEGYRNHIAAEEQLIVPYAAYNLSAMEWKSVATGAPLDPEPFQQYGASRRDPTFGSEADALYLALCARIQKDRLERPKGYAVYRADDRPDDGARFLAKEDRPLRPSVAARRLIVRRTIALLALVLAFLNLYLLDVNLQIARLPSVVLLP